MNNDKLLIIVIVLVLYLLCFRRSEGQDTEGDYICKYTDGQLDGVIRGVVANMFGTKVDDSGKFTQELTLNQPLKIVAAGPQFKIGNTEGNIYTYGARDDDIYITDFSGNYNHEMDPWDNRVSPS